MGACELKRQAKLEQWKTQVIDCRSSGIVAGKQKSSLAIMAAAFLAVCIFNVNVVYVVIFCIVLGVVRTLIRKRKEKKR